MMFRQAWHLAQLEVEESLLRKVWEADNEMDARVAYSQALQGVSLPKPQTQGAR